MAIETFHAEGALLRVLKPLANNMGDDNKPAGRYYENIFIRCSR